MLCLPLSCQSAPFYLEVSLDRRYINNCIWLFSTFYIYISVISSSQPEGSWKGSSQTWEDLAEEALDAGEVILNSRLPRSPQIRP